MSYLESIPAMQQVMTDADVIDIKVFKGQQSMREFIAGLIAYQPGWVTFLFRVRKVFVRFLGLRQEGIPTAPHYAPAEIPMEVGEKVGFFDLEYAAENQYWIVSAAESHLKAWLAVVVEPLNPSERRFYVVTVVHHRRWTGPVYFNVIRPFHHIVVRRMAQAGLKYPHSSNPDRPPSSVPDDSTTHPLGHDAPTATAPSTIDAA